MTNDFGGAIVGHPGLVGLVGLACFVRMFFNCLFRADDFLLRVLGFGVALVAFIVGGADVPISLLFGHLFRSIHIGVGFLQPGLEFRRRLGGFRALPRTKYSMQVVLGIRADRIPVRLCA